VTAPDRLALVIRSAPWRERSGREALDLATAAVTMDLDLDLFFIGAGVEQLLANRQPGPAAYPAGLKAWAALADFGPVSYYAERAAAERLEQAGGEFLVPVTCIEAGEMPALQQTQRHVLVL